MAGTNHIAAITESKDLLGKQIGRWKILEYCGQVFGISGRARCKRSMWLCKCSCGNQRKLRKTALFRQKNCGCENKRNTKHGGSRTITYNTWSSMIARCYSPKNISFGNYGRKGVTVCERWRNSFPDFLADMGPRPKGMTIDRFPNKDGNYEPSNCRWVTNKEQGRNRSTNRILEFRGESLCCVEWAERFGLTPTIINQRLKRGWSVEKTLLMPKPPG